MGDQFEELPFFQGRILSHFALFVNKERLPTAMKHK
jgi:hypothetical protein